jgi:hypothetical protein
MSTRTVGAGIAGCEKPSSIANENIGGLLNERYKQLSSEIFSMLILGFNGVITNLCRENVILYQTILSCDFKTGTPFTHE